MKLKPTLLDKIFRRDKFKEIIELRNQIDFMVSSFMKIDILDRMNKYSKQSDEIFKFDFYTLNEVDMYNHLGEKAVIIRLISDRDKLYNTLKNIKEIDISNISKCIREEKLNKLFN